VDQQRIIFESSPAYILLCAILAIAASFFLYRDRHPWSKLWNRILFGARALLTFCLLFLLLGPIVKQIKNIFEKPLLVLLVDNSVSVGEVMDSVSVQRVEENLSAVNSLLEDQGFDVKTVNLKGEDRLESTFSESTSDLNGALKKIANRFESSQISGVILLSDGIYNEGISPLYSPYPFPVFTVGVGDTTQRTDVFIKDVAYNKIVYQGNKFPVRVEVMVKNLPSEFINVTLSHRGKVLDQQSKPSTGDQLLVFDFQPMADEQGIQKLDISIDVKQGEYNTVNNRGSVFIEVVEGKKKILLVAPSPHPDIKALREVVEQNPNYDFLLHIPGIEEQKAATLIPDKIDLAIFHQSPDLKGKTREIFQAFVNSQTSLFLILGLQTDIPFLAKQGMPVSFEAPPRDHDEVLPVTSATFSYFILSSQTNNTVLDYPPVSVPFGKLKIPGNSLPLLLQRVGSVTTEKPLLYVNAGDNRRIGVMLGEGLWRWRLNEFERLESTVAFDELFGKLLQYLSTADDKRKFRSYPVKQEFSDTEAVVFESQVYNDIFEPIYGNTIDIELVDEQSKRSQYTYTINPGNVRYQIGGLQEGVYRYTAKTVLKDKDEIVRGEFAVVKRQAELQDLTADFDMLRKLSANSGGKFYAVNRFDDLRDELRKTEAKTILHSEESFNAMVNLKWVFWLLLLMVSMEWFARKFFGSY